MMGMIILLSCFIFLARIVLIFFYFPSEQFYFNSDLRISISIGCFLFYMFDNFYFWMTDA